MPFLNFHSARILEPKFEKYSYKKLGTGVDLVFGIKDGKTHTQAIRFNVKDFTPDEAKAWLKKHNKKYKSFHSAKSVKEDAGPASAPSGPGAISMTTTSDIAQYAKKVLPMVSRQGDKKKKTLRETLEYIVNDKENSRRIY